MNGAEERPGRETRLLVLVIVVSLAVLFLLARFRFPPAGLTAGPPSPGPLDRLAARATFDDLAAAIASVVQRVEPSVVIVQVDAAPPEEKDKGQKEKGVPPPPPAQPPPPARLLPGIRLRSDLALVHVPIGMRVSPAQGFTGPTSVFATDPKREIALVRVAPLPESTTGVPSVFEGFPGFSYVAVVEAAMGGPTARPAFIGRLDTSVDDRWQPSPLLIGGASEAPAGSLLFAVDGRFIGMVLPQFGTLAVVPPAALNAVVTELGGGAGAGGLADTESRRGRGEAGARGPRRSTGAHGASSGVERRERRPLVGVQRVSEWPRGW
ncbi:MAG TPA: hypothetical protein VES67_22255 [Vicinamibacterales bacterium]|nr:hypothetical protein [Vicinamibacterales bacterium]